MKEATGLAWGILVRKVSKTGPPRVYIAGRYCFSETSHQQCVTTAMIPTRREARELAKRAREWYGCTRATPVRVRWTVEAAK